MNFILLFFTYEKRSRINYRRKNYYFSKERRLNIEDGLGGKNLK